MPDTRDEAELLRMAEAIADRAPLTPVDGATGAGARMKVIAAAASAFRAAIEGGGREAPLFRWGSLDVTRKLGEGSYGEVFAAWDPALQREVALKLRRPEEGVLRWLDEARAVARVRHPHVLHVYGADLRDGRAGIWTDLVPGRTLEAVLVNDGPLPAVTVARIGRDIAGALEAVHAAGIVHGDLKPANIMLEGSGPVDDGARVVLMDFGASQDVAAEAPAAHTFGTPLAMAPELLVGGAPTPASDVYALGVLLHRLLTGRYPVEAGSLEELRAKHAQSARSALAAVRPAPPAALVRAIERALERDPARRFEGAVAMRRALARALERGRRRRRLAVAASAALAVLSAALLIAGVVQRRALRERAVGSSPAMLHPHALGPAWSLRGSGVESGLGWHLSGAGDVNGDGRPDILVSEPNWMGTYFQQGRALLYLSTPRALVRAQWTPRGHNPQAYFGSQLATAGDVNHDGFDDILVAEVNYRTAVGPVGAVFLYFGSPSGLRAKPDWRYIGTQPNANLGDGMCNAGDVNGDGYDDVLIGSTLERHHFRNEGAVRLFLGTADGLSLAPAWTTYGGSEDANLGWRVRAAHDLNHDGYADIAIGVHRWTRRHFHGGKVCVYYGGPRGPAIRPDWSLEGSTDEGQFGYEVASLDMNGDGYTDLAVSQPSFSSHDYAWCGRVLLFPGGPHGIALRPAWTMDGFSLSSHFGLVVCPVGDVNGDGLEDLMVGAPNYTRSSEHLQTGLAALLCGRRQGAPRVPDWYVYGTDRDEWFGVSIGAVGDINGDGLADVLVGAPEHTERAQNDGRVLLFRGRR